MGLAQSQAEFNLPEAIGPSWQCKTFAMATPMPAKSIASSIHRSCWLIKCQGRGFEESGRTKTDTIKYSVDNIVDGKHKIAAVDNLSS